MKRVQASAHNPQIHWGAAVTFLTTKSTCNTVAASLAAMTVLLSGCSSPPSTQTVITVTQAPATARVSQATTTSITPSTDSTSSDSSSSSSSAVPLPSETTLEGEIPTTTTSPVLTPGKNLTLSDFFNPTPGWSENRFDLADKGQVQGISLKVDYCQDLPGDELELRLGNKFQRLKFSVGQANNSMSSDQNLTVEVIANNRQLDIRRIPFNSVQKFDLPVSGVNALRILFYLDSQVPHCGGSVNGVIFDSTLVS